MWYKQIMKEEDYRAKQEEIVRSLLEDRRRLEVEGLFVRGAAYAINEGLKAINKLPPGPLTRSLRQAGVSLCEETLAHVEERIQRMKKRSTETKAAIYYLQDHGEE